MTAAEDSRVVAAPRIEVPDHASASRFAHRVGLDGLRGAAVAAVLLFHSQLEWAEGGYLGVSTFFTLSGFLITTLLMREAVATERIDLVGFWLRRIRRLLPAALAAIVLALGYVALFGDGAAVDGAVGDAISALFYVANWHLVLADQSYADLFREASPFQHLWSLAIEEQFYLLLPLLGAAAARAASPARRLATISAGGIAVSVVISLALGSDPDRLYYGTDTRAAEILLGVLLACLEHEFGLSTRLARLLRIAGPLAFVGIVGLWSTVAQTSDLLHPWLLLVNATLTAVVILSLLEPGRFTEALSVRPLVWLGLVSYGVYVYHWPIFLWLDETRTGLDGASLLAVRLAVTLTAAWASARFIESPIRYPPAHLARSPRREFRTAGFAILAVAVVAAAIPAAISRPPTIDFDSAARLQDELADVPAPSVPSPTAEADGTGDEAPTAEVPFSDPPRVAVFGDSTALLFVPGLVEWAAQTELIEVTPSAAFIGCSVSRKGKRTDGVEVLDLLPSCEFSTFWPPALELGQPDIAVVEIGVWDVTDRILPGEDVIRTIGDPVYDRYLRSEIEAATELLLGTAKHVVWVLQPLPVRATRDADDPVFERLPMFNEMLVTVLGDHPQVSFIDLEGWLASTPDGTESLRLRPDGTHFSEETSVELAEWLGPAILEAARRDDIVRADDVVPVPVAR